MRVERFPVIDRWTLVRGGWSIDPNDLLAAVNEELKSESPDYRTRLLLRESLLVLRERWSFEQLVDRIPLDIFVGKLSSRRGKDLDDLRTLKSGFVADDIVERLKSSGGSLLAADQCRQNLIHNWYILFGSKPPVFD